MDILNHPEFEKLRDLYILIMFIIIASRLAAQLVRLFDKYVYQLLEIIAIIICVKNISSIISIVKIE
jgi:hypothetical protein